MTNSSQNFNAPGGVIATPVYQNNLAGTLATSQTATNLAISNEGFFAVAAPTSSGLTTGPNTTSTYYTRRGDFQLDQNDYLVNGAGTISPSAIEQSNVDIAGQFTNLIVAQEAYTANTKVVSTTNQLLTSLLQIVT